MTSESCWAFPELISTISNHSIDFWLVKNLSGRLLAGLRWWNVVVIVEKEGNNANGNANADSNAASVVAVVKKRFECRDRAQRESSPIPPSQVQGGPSFYDLHKPLSQRDFS